MVAEGRERDAWRLWASVVELVHLGSPRPALSTAGFPPVRRFVARTSPVPVARIVGAVSSSHGSECGTAAAYWFKRDLDRLKRGSVIMRGRRASTFWRFSGWRRTSARWTFCPSTWVWPWSGWTRALMASPWTSSPSGPMWEQGQRPWREPWSSWWGHLASPARWRMQGGLSSRSWAQWRPTLSSFPRCASSVANPPLSPVESVDRSRARAAILVTAMLACVSALSIAATNGEKGAWIALKHVLETDPLNKHPKAVRILNESRDKARTSMAAWVDCRLASFSKAP